MKIILGTRGSALARWQTQSVMEALARAAPEITMEGRVIQTRGDRDKTRPLTQFGERGVFTKEIERALLAGEIDAAVHSLKDLPGELADDFVLAAMLPREDARDCLVSRHGIGLLELPQGARVGTSSTRRAAQVLALRPDVVIVPLRGNVDTRLNKAQTDEYDAIVLAAAGILRLGRGNEITEYLEPERMLPEPGQGAIAVEIRATDSALAEIFSRIDHAPTRGAVTAERAFLRTFGGGCRNPLGAYAAWEGGVMRLRGMVGLPDGSRLLGGELYGEVGQGDTARATDLGTALANELLANGASEILLGKSDLPLAGKRIVVTRTQEQASELAKKIGALGGTALEWSTIALAPLDDTQALDDTLARLDAFDWIVLTSGNGVRAVAERLRVLGLTLHADAHRIAAVGPMTAQALEAEGMRAAFVPERFTGEELARTLPAEPGARILLLHAEIASDDLPKGLRARGMDVTEVVAYRTGMPEKPQMDLQDADAVTFASASAVKNLVAMLDERERAELARRDIFCIGPATAEAARAAGLPITAVAKEHTLQGLVNAMTEFYGGVFRQRTP